MHRITAWRHFNAGTLPPELQAKKIGNIIYVLANPGTTTGRTVGYARVSSQEQKPPLASYHRDILAFMAQPPDDYEFLRERLRNLPEVSGENTGPLFHSLDADVPIPPAATWDWRRRY